MDILFASTKLRKIFNTQRQLIRTYGADRANRISKRMVALRLAETLADMRTLPGRCHELKGNRAGQLSLGLDHPHRLIFEPAHEPVPRTAEGSLDWARVTAVIIIGVEDTHG